MGRHQLAALRAEFSRIPMVDLRLDATLSPRRRSRSAWPAAALVVAGSRPTFPVAGRGCLPRARWRQPPGRARAAPAAAAAAAARCARWMTACRRPRRLPPAASRGGCCGWSGATTADCYRAQFDHGDPPSASVVAEICKRAVRPNAEAVGDQLADGTWITLSPGGDDLPRLARGRPAAAEPVRALAAHPGGRAHQPDGGDVPHARPDSRRPARRRFRYHPGRDPDRAGARSSTSAWWPAT